MVGRLRQARAAEGADVLQINTGKYFKDRSDVHETLQRHVLHTNTWIGDRTPVRVGEAELAWSTGHSALRTVTVSIVERLEKTNPDGSESILIAVGGREIVQAIGEVLSFVLDATFDLDADLVGRLTTGATGGPRTLLHRPFASERLVTAGELEDAEEFLCGLLDLNRENYEAAMRAIRCVVSAARTARTDPTLAYTLYVAALESLAQTTDAPPVLWERLDGRKRVLLDAALTGLPEEDAERIRQAVLDAERAGLASRFQAFVLGHVTGGYYRDGAAGLLPARASELPTALKEAYRVRSGNVHTLTELPKEAWATTGGFDTVRPAGGRTLLTIEGIHRLARHVVRNWAERAQTVETKPFSFWDALPNVLRMEVASEYWVWMADGLTAASAGSYLTGALDIWLGVVGGHRDAWVDLRDVLARIEKLAAGTATEQRTWMVALYAVWHGNVRTEDRRPGGDEFLAKHARLLAPPSMVSFVVALTTDRLGWPLEDYERTAALRRAQRGRKQDWQVPAVFDAALLAVLADQLEKAGRHDEAVAAVDEAIGELPANPELMRIEQSLARREPLGLDLLGVLAPDAAPDRSGQQDPAPQDTGPGAHADQAGDVWADTPGATLEEA
jgi:hypothetical protein